MPVTVERRAGTAVALTVQVATRSRAVPAAGLLEAAVRAALAGRRQRAEINLRLVGRGEARALNRRFRGRDAPTNVLSFPVGEDGMPVQDFIGDIAICAPLVPHEARRQGKTLAAHWSHLVVHGVLHLLGYDHVEAEAAHEMEDIERAILAGLGYPDPYQT